VVPIPARGSLNLLAYPNNSVYEGVRDWLLVDSRELECCEGAGDFLAGAYFFGAGARFFFGAGLANDPPSSKNPNLAPPSLGGLLERSLPS
jgi:hypothetical protein